MKTELGAGLEKVKDLATRQTIETVDVRWFKMVEYELQTLWIGNIKRKMNEEKTIVLPRKGRIRWSEDKLY
jgi:hypothetical protein